MKERIFSSLPGDVSLEELVAEVDFYHCLEERFDLLFVRGLVEDHANSSSQGPYAFTDTEGCWGSFISCPLEGIPYARLAHPLADLSSLIPSMGNRGQAAYQIAVCFASIPKRKCGMSGRQFGLK